MALLAGENLEYIDKKFYDLVISTAPMETLYDGCRWAEGPVWFNDGGYLLWSDIPNNRILRYTPDLGVSTFRSPANYTNGHTRDLQGRLISCSHGARAVLRTEPDGTVTTLVDSYQGKRLNSPNDVVVKSDGSIWFSDPPFGIGGYYEGYRAEPQLPTHLYRLDPSSGKLAVAAGDMLSPNGLAFSPDESRLYVVQSRARPHRNIVVYDVIDGVMLANPRVLIDAGPGTPDGLRCDEDGNLWCGWGMGSPELDGVMVFNPEGERIGRIALPERCANLCFGGPQRNRLFMAGSQSLYALYVNTRGAP
jgi:gluconolactonase